MSEIFWERVDSASQEVALDGRFGRCTYEELRRLVLAERNRFRSIADLSGEIVQLSLDPSPPSVARFLALMQLEAIIAPVEPSDVSRAQWVSDIVTPRYSIGLDGTMEVVGGPNRHPLIETLRAQRSPGLILLTSGSTGTPKAVVHDMVRMLQRFDRPGRADRTGVFMSLDHIGGVNTLLYCLANLGCAIGFPNRQPDAVVDDLVHFRVEVLPTTPSFLRLLLTSGALEDTPLDSLRLITYGGEPMPDTTRENLKRALPHVELMQQFGMSETGVLRSRSREDGWMRLGGDGYGVRVVHGQLEIKSKTAMLGYLNAPSPFAEDGWLRTGDRAEQDGEYLRVLGRESQMINVGGENVDPLQVESILESLEGVSLAQVSGEAHPILGSILCAVVQLETVEDASAFRKRLRGALTPKVPKHLIPSKVTVSKEPLLGPRMKKGRASGANNAMQTTLLSRQETLSKAAQRHFEFLKGLDALPQIWAAAIQLEEGSGYLLPITRLHTEDEELIETLARWREASQHAYPGQFPVSFAGTKNWLRDRVIGVPDRMLFLIVDAKGTPVGHVGLANGLNRPGWLEVDNLLRGSLQGHRDIAAFAMKALVQWTRETLGPEGLYLRVLASLPRVMDLDKRIGFVEVNRVPLRRHHEGEAILLKPLTPEDTGVPDDEFVEMQFPPTHSTGEKLILTAGPSISAREATYALDAAQNGWNNQWSKYLNRFEASFAEFVGRKYAIATSSCTGALHLSLLALGIGPGDEVIVPDITWVATANAVRYTGATPVFADVDPATWCLDAESARQKITPRTKAILPVHLYGHPADMTAICALAAEHGLAIVEDAAPAIGATADGKKAGSFGDFAAFSFQGAKLLVTGEGGMLVTDDEDLYRRVHRLWDQGRDPSKVFWIDQDGWKYKMSNIQAALGLGQLERVEELVEMKRRIFDWYSEDLSGLEGVRLQAEAPYARSIYWMSNIEVADHIDREALRAELKKRNIDTRPVFPAISQYPIWPVRQEPAPVAYRIGQQGINLPSGVKLTRDEIAYVSRNIRELVLAARPVASSLARTA